MSIREFIKKLQELPIKQRKIILWVIIAILGLTLCLLWLKITKERLKGFGKEEIMEELNLPAFEEKLQEIPKLGDEQQ